MIPNDQTEAVLLWFGLMFFVLACFAALEGPYERWMVRRWLRRQREFDARASHYKNALRSTVHPSWPGK